MVIASGPFTLGGNLTYEPLHALLAFCAQVKPDLLLLLGPFVDAEHPLIADNLADRPFGRIFQESVSACSLSHYMQINRLLPECLNC